MDVIGNSLLENLSYLAGIGAFGYMIARDVYRRFKKAGDGKNGSTGAA